MAESVPDLVEVDAAEEERAEDDADAQRYDELQPALQALGGHGGILTTAPPRKSYKANESRSSFSPGDEAART